jgi:hypothetical protein
LSLSPTDRLGLVTVQGKVQVLGLGTAIKILMGSPDDKVEGRFSFQRNELIALINTAHQVGKYDGRLGKASSPRTISKIFEFMIFDPTFTSWPRASRP